MTAYELRRHLETHHTMIIRGRGHATLADVHRRDHERRPVIAFTIVHEHDEGQP